MGDRKSPSTTDQDRSVKLLERAVPWVVFTLVVTIVVLSLIAVVVGAPWAR